MLKSRSEKYGNSEIRCESEKKKERIKERKEKKRGRETIKERKDKGEK